MAFFLQEKILDEFIANIGTQPISFINPSSISFPEIDAYIQEYKDPRRAGTIVGVQEDELDETKIIPVRPTTSRSRLYHLMTGPW